MARRVTVYEAGPRDGLQNEAGTVATADKLALISALAGAGLSRIEATSFVSPRWIPQLADAADVVARLPAGPGASYVVLVPNAKGLERLVAALDRVFEPIVLGNTLYIGFNDRDKVVALDTRTGKLRLAVAGHDAGLWLVPAKGPRGFERKDGPNDAASRRCLGCTAAGSVRIAAIPEARHFDRGGARQPGPADRGSRFAGRRSAPPVLGPAIQPIRLERRLRQPGTPSIGRTDDDR